MPTKAGLPGWFPEDFSTDPELLDAFEDTAAWHAAGRKPANGKPRVHQHARSWDELSRVLDLAAGDDCYRCSTANAPDARYCKRCGNPMEPRQPYDRFAAEDVTCPFCGRGDEKDAVHCDQCGKRLPEGPFAAFANGTRAVDLSARTAMLEATPAPIGKPGGPGLYHVKGLGHSNYYDQVRNGLMKRGVPEGKAHAMTWGILRRWAAGGGGVHPEVRAAAVKALAEEKAKAAVAHAHSVTWDDHARVIGLAAVPTSAGGGPARPAPPRQAPAAAPTSSGSPSGSGSPQARVPAGQVGGGQFGSGSGQATTAKTAPAKAPAKPAQTAAQSAHAARVAHVASTQKVSTAKAELLVTAQDDRAKAAALISQRDALAKALASASGKVSKGQAGAKTASTAKTKTTAPATSGTATAAASAGTTAAKTTASIAKTAGKTSAAAAAAAPPKPGSAAAIKAQIAQLNIQIASLLAAAEKATVQAAAMQ